jgi:predicted RNA-binding protein with PIN domain
MSRRVLIDAMNVIRANPSLLKVEDRRGIAAARQELLRLCGEHVERAGRGAEYTIVFDGADSGATDVDAAGALLIIYAGERTADEVIIEKAEDARALGHEAWVISNDAEVCAAGTHAMRSEEFYEALISRPPSPAPSSRSEMAKRLVEHLVAAGHLPRNAAADANLIDDLTAHLDYYALGEAPAQRWPSGWRRSCASAPASRPIPIRRSWCTAS